MSCSLIFMMLLSCLLLPSARAGRSVLPEEDDMALERALKMLNKPYVKSIKDKYGVVFDCVDMYKQPALDHPLLKNHKLQISPSTSSNSTWTGPTMAGEPILVGLQESCPDGTVLIRRTLKQDLVKARASLPRFRQEKDQSETPGQHFAQLLINSEEGSKFQAAGAVLEVDAISVPAGQVSSAQILLVDDTSSRRSIIQSGWSADPLHEIDSQTRFFTSWTADDHKTTGCLNMLCPGFVLVNQNASPGIALSTGTAGISISKDGQTGNWQVFLNQQIVGYFPKEIINGMSGAAEVQMGGMTYSPPGQKSPPMGSGVAPVPGQNTLASKFTQVGVQGAKIGKYWATKDVSDPAIYNVVMTSGPQGDSFQYGGPGGV
ncbi:unnamed protein product [Urochloa decumbens]|uniref:Neprosin PEP catalytic domain-containing protein n=1 Tax=Urochloa decumbens TaxID=240449 RepID=A0ABC9BDM7_9POAL